MWLKTIVSKAHYYGLTPRNPFAQYRVNQNIKERQYLTEEEIKSVMTHEFADKKLAYILPLPSAVLSTGLKGERFSG